MKVALIEINNTHFWCDSSVTLAWIRGQPYQWKEFVRNRVTEIQETTDKSRWRHVRSEHNPADIISRGANPEQLIRSTIWWHGPEWLKNDEANWPILHARHEVSETRTSSFSFLTTVTIEEFFTRYSSLRKLQRVIAHIFRFSNNVKTSIAKNELQTGPLTVEELQRAINILVKLAQRHSFKQEVNDLKNKRSVNPRSRLFDLHVYWWRWSHKGQWTFEKRPAPVWKTVSDYPTYEASVNEIDYIAFS